MDINSWVLATVMDLLNLNSERGMFYSGFISRQTDGGLKFTDIQRAMDQKTHYKPQ